MNYLLMHPKYGYVSSVMVGGISFTIYPLGAMRYTLDAASDFKFRLGATGYDLSELQIVKLDDVLVANA